MNELTTLISTQSKLFRLQHVHIQIDLSNGFLPTQNRIEAERT